jgi:hypothetical protein
LFRLSILRDAPRWFLAVLASPFTLVEQSRGRWRTAVLVAYGLLAMVVCTPLVRKARLDQISNLGDPFDVAAFRDGGSDDAFPLYQQALSRCDALSHQRAVPLSNGALAFQLSAGYATPDVEAGIASRREARDLWLRATARPSLSYHPWDGRGFGAEWFDGGMGFDNKTGKQLSFRIDSPERGLLRGLAEREANRLEEVGDLAAAWTWYNAALRYSRHVGMRTIAADRLQAVTLHRDACERAELWASDDRVDATLLRRALADALAVGAMTPHLSDAIKADYLEAMLLLEHLPGVIVNWVVEDYRGSGERVAAKTPLPRKRWQFGRGNDGFEGEVDRIPQYLPNLPTRAAYYFNGEPERSKRLVRQVYANWLAHCDEPAHLQPRTLSDLNLFAATPGSPRMLPAEELARELDRPGPARYVLAPWNDLVKPLQEERSRQAKLVVTLAEELYLREHGKRPASSQELVGPYLSELPAGFAAEPPTRDRPDR